MTLTATRYGERPVVTSMPRHTPAFDERRGEIEDRIDAEMDDWAGPNQTWHAHFATIIQEDMGLPDIDQGAIWWLVKTKAYERYGTFYPQRLAPRRGVRAHPRQQDIQDWVEANIETYADEREGWHADMASEGIQELGLDPHDNSTVWGDAFSELWLAISLEAKRRRLWPYDGIADPAEVARHDSWHGRAPTVRMLGRALTPEEWQTVQDTIEAELDEWGLSGWAAWHANMTDWIFGEVLGIAPMERDFSQWNKVYEAVRAEALRRYGEYYPGQRSAQVRYSPEDTEAYTNFDRPRVKDKLGAGANAHMQPYLGDIQDWIDAHIEDYALGTNTHWHGDMAEDVVAEFDHVPWLDFAYVWAMIRETADRRWGSYWPGRAAQGTRLQPIGTWADGTPMYDERQLWAQLPADEKQALLDYVDMHIEDYPGKPFEGWHLELAIEAVGAVYGRDIYDPTSKQAYLMRALNLEIIKIARQKWGTPYPGRSASVRGWLPPTLAGLQYVSSMLGGPMSAEMREHRPDIVAWVDANIEEFATPHEGWHATMANALAEEWGWPEWLDTSWVWAFIRQRAEVLWGTPYPRRSPSTNTPPTIGARVYIGSTNPMEKLQGQFAPEWVREVAEEIAQAIRDLVAETPEAAITEGWHARWASRLQDDFRARYRGEAYNPKDDIDAYYTFWEAISAEVNRVYGTHRPGGVGRTPRGKRDYDGIPTEGLAETVRDLCGQQALDWVDAQIDNYARPGRGDWHAALTEDAMQANRLKYDGQFWAIWRYVHSVADDLGYNVRSSLSSPSTRFTEVEKAYYFDDDPQTEIVTLPIYEVKEFVRGWLDRWMVNNPANEKDCPEFGMCDIDRMMMLICSEFPHRCSTDAKRRYTQKVVAELIEEEYSHMPWPMALRTPTPSSSSSSSVRRSGGLTPEERAQFQDIMEAEIDEWARPDPGWHLNFATYVLSQMGFLSWDMNAVVSNETWRMVREEAERRGLWPWDGSDSGNAMLGTMHYSRPSQLGGASEARFEFEQYMKGNRTRSLRRLTPEERAEARDWIEVHIDEYARPQAGWHAELVGDLMAQSGLFGAEFPGEVVYAALLDEVYAVARRKYGSAYPDAQAQRTVPARGIRTRKLDAVADQVEAEIEERVRDLQGDPSTMWEGWHADTAQDICNQFGLMSFEDMETVWMLVRLELQRVFGYVPGGDRTAGKRISVSQAEVRLYEIKGEILDWINANIEDHQHGYTGWHMEMAWEACEEFGLPRMWQIYTRIHEWVREEAKRRGLPPYDRTAPSRGTRTLHSYGSYQPSPKLAPILDQVLAWMEDEWRNSGFYHRAGGHALMAEDAMVEFELNHPYPGDHRDYTLLWTWADDHLRTAPGVRRGSYGAGGQIPGPTPANITRAEGALFDRKSEVRDWIRANIEDYARQTQGGWHLEMAYAACEALGFPTYPRIVDVIIGWVHDEARFRGLYPYNGYGQVRGYYDAVKDVHVVNSLDPISVMTFVRNELLRQPDLLDDWAGAVLYLHNRITDLDTTWTLNDVESVLQKVVLQRGLYTSADTDALDAYRSVRANVDYRPGSWTGEDALKAWIDAHFQEYAERGEDGWHISLVFDAYKATGTPGAATLRYIDWFHYVEDMAMEQYGNLYPYGRRLALAQYRAAREARRRLGPGKRILVGADLQRVIDYVLAAMPDIRKSTEAWHLDLTFEALDALGLPDNGGNTQQVWKLIQKLAVDNYGSLYPDR